MGDPPPTWLTREDLEELLGRPGRRPLSLLVATPALNCFFDWTSSAGMDSGSAICTASEV